MAILHEIFRNNVLFTHIKAFSQVHYYYSGKRNSIMPLCGVWWHLSPHFYVSHLEVFISASLRGSPFTVILKYSSWRSILTRQWNPNFSIPLLDNKPRGFKGFQGLWFLFLSTPRFYPVAFSDWNSMTIRIHSLHCQLKHRILSPWGFAFVCLQSTIHKAICFREIFDWWWSRWG